MRRPGNWQGRYRIRREGRLVSGLCDVYDRTRQDIRRGQLTLAELFYNDKTPLPYRLEAGVALGRTTQLMKERARSVPRCGRPLRPCEDFRSCAQARAGQFGGSQRLLLPDPRAARESGTGRRRFRGTRNLFSVISGGPEVLPPLHLLAEYEYIRLRRDYKNAAGT